MKTAANRKDKIAGIVCAAAGAVAYGLNPFFGIPLYKEGMLPLSVLFYRLTFGAVLMGGVMLARRQSFVLPKRYIAAVAGNGVLLALSCFFCFLSFRIMSSGISATLQFVYPVMVALIMFAFFRERLRLPAVCGVVLAVSGTALLCTPAEGVNVSALGISYSMLSAFTYALYIIAVKMSRLKELPAEKLTFYVMIFAIPVFLIPLRFGADIQMLPSWKAFGNALGLALFPTLTAFLFTAVAIPRIGATFTSIMGALEPVTGVLVGIFFFGEKLDLSAFGGIALILSAVIFVICGTVGKRNQDK